MDLGIGLTSYDTPGSGLLLLFDGLRWMYPSATFSNGWHHVVLNLDASGHPTAFLDGALVYTDALSPAAPPAPNIVAVGNDYGGGSSTRFFPGALDEAAVYAHTLTTSQVQNHYLWGLYGC